MSEEVKQFRVRDVVAYIQEMLLIMDEGFFIDGEAIAAIIELEHDFYIMNGIDELKLDITGEPD